MTSESHLAPDIITRHAAALGEIYSHATLTSLLQSYAEPQRFYHTQRHIADLLLLLERYRSTAHRPSVITHAILWHDVIYVTQDTSRQYRSDQQNVIDSMAHFERANLTLAATDKDAVLAMIRATAGHQISDTTIALYPGFQEDLQLFLDFDLSQFAKPWPDFIHDTTRIRQEFAWVETKRFCEERAKILNHFLIREPLYTRVPDREKWTEQARHNLVKSISLLQSGHISD
jgi:predicted metal-dependent HD superfamily phosphohydrolase